MRIILEFSELCKQFRLASQGISLQFKDLNLHIKLNLVTLDESDKFSPIFSQTMTLWAFKAIRISTMIFPKKMFTRLTWPLIRSVWWWSLATQLCLHFWFFWHFYFFIGKRGVFMILVYDYSFFSWCFQRMRDKLLFTNTNYCCGIFTQ